MESQSIVSPEDQNVTFVELFFDLVFVFSVTQIVGLMHGHIDWTVAGQAILVFWLVWWAWTQFTWALNSADTTHPWIMFGTLLATAIAFFMAVTLPEVFQGKAIWFAIPYVLVRVIGLAIYGWVAMATPDLLAPVKTFSLVSAGGLIAVLAGGFLGGTMVYWFWGAAIILDIIAANIGGQSDGWNIHPEHFSERHGLFVIIALGESLIVAGSGVVGTVWNGDLIIVAIASVIVTCGLWWSYFSRIKPNLDHAMESSGGTALSMMARDVYSLIHFPMLCGVIATAVAFEQAIAHPDTPFLLAGRMALAIGLILFVGGLGVAHRRAVGQVLVPRILITVSTGIIIILVPDVAPFISLMIAFTGISAVAVVEQRTIRYKGSSTFSCE